MTLHQYRKKKLNDYLYDHKVLRNILENLNPLFISIIAALIFAFGFSAFITPYQDSQLTIATGGVSGFSQDIAMFMKVCFNVVVPDNVVQAGFYTILNIPILTFAFFKVGKKFTIYTILNVVLSSVLIWVFGITGIGEKVGTSELIASSNFTRAMFGSLCVGLSSALAFKGDLSCGGIDVISYYLSIRKSTGAGKIGAVINSFIISAFALLSSLDDLEHWEVGFVSIFFSITYLFITAIMVDTINQRNKKIRVEIITSKTMMSDILMANFPHGCTIVKGVGAYTGAEREIVICVVSSREVKNVVRVAKMVDDHAFISVMPLVQVYGNFYIKPVE